MKPRPETRPGQVNLAGLLDLLSRRGALELFTALTGPPRSRKALVNLRGPFAESVWCQRLADLCAAEVIEEIPESGDFRLSARGRRIQGVLDQLEQAVGT